MFAPQLFLRMEQVREFRRGLLQVQAALMRLLHITFCCSWQAIYTILGTCMDQKGKHIGCDSQGDPDLSKGRDCDRLVANAAAPHGIAPRYDPPGILREPWERWAILKIAVKGARANRASF